MNLHLVPDDKFVSRVIERIEAVGLLSNNKFIVKKTAPFKYLRQSWLQGAQPNTPEFAELTGDLSSYNRIFIHFMGEDSVRWVVNNNVKNIYWMPWGADIYESLFSGGFQPNDNITEQILGVTLRNRFNRTLVGGINKFRQRSLYSNAYSRIGTVCNWIDGEYHYANQHLPGLKAGHKFFLYDNDIALDKLAVSEWKSAEGRPLRVQLGQSTTAAGNHGSALNDFRKVKEIGEVVIPASYGSGVYAGRLESWVAQQKFPFAVNFNKGYVPFDQFVNAMNTFDVLALNSRRPAGMGNFWLAIYLGKAVLLRKENLAAPMLKGLGVTFYYIDDWCRNVQLPSEEQVKKNREVVLNFYSEARLQNAYRELFA